MAEIQALQAGNGSSGYGLDPDEDAAIPFAEDTLALQFADIYAESMRYVAKWGRWMCWNGSVWLEDSTLQVFDKVRAMCRVEAALAKSQSKSNNPDAAARKLLDGKVIASVERLARSDRRLAATVEQWDSDLWVLNTPGGAVDLRGGDTREPRAEDYLTRCTAVSPASGPMPIWMAFLQRITAGDEDLQAYIQRVCGYCLTGTTLEHALFFLYGTGANGKSVLVNTISAIMGDYALSASMDIFLQKKNEEHSTAIARLMGARLVSVIETEKGARWAEAKLKALTGGDKISARFMRQDFFEYSPQFKLIIAGNHKPTIRGVDEAMRRRMNLIPFTTTIPEAERDAELFDRLKAEWPAILDWMVTGCLAWQSYRLSPPAAVTIATGAYLEAEDAMGQWLNERCDLDPSAYTLGADLYADWKAWAEHNGEYIGGTKGFGQNLEDRGIKRRKEAGTGRRGFQGIAIRKADLFDGADKAAF